MPTGTTGIASTRATTAYTYIFTMWEGVHVYGRTGGAGVIKNMLGRDRNMENLRASCSDGSLSPLLVPRGRIDGTFLCDT